MLRHIPPKLRYPALVLGLLLAGLLLWLALRDDAAPQLVTATVERADIEDTVLASGTLEAFQEVSVGAQVSGQLKSLKVRLGDRVKKGQLIAEIDSLPQRNALRDRESALRTVRAQRAAKLAALKKSELELKRQKTMLDQDATSRADFETAQATFEAQQAELAALDAQIAQAEVAVDTARLNLGYTQLTAPIAGTVVAIVTQEGQTVSAGLQAPTILKLANTGTMTVKAQISEADVPRVRERQKVYFTILGEPEQRYYGTLRAIEPAPESESQESNGSSASATQAAAVYYNGLFDVENPDGKLRVAMTAQVNIVLAEAKNALAVPAMALERAERKGGRRSGEGKTGDGKADDGRKAGKGNQEGRKGREGKGGYVVRVVGADGQPVERKVRVGLNNNVTAQILEGLEEGEKVVLGETRPGEKPEMSERDRRRAQQMMGPR
jgi:macrolide-specific efflux system membrane fusion protein